MNKTSGASAHGAADTPTPTPTPPPTPALGRAHRARLMQIWRSAGWPHRDAIDLDLIAAGLAAPVWATDAHETLRLTAEGMAWLSTAREANRRAAGPHDRLAARVANKLMESGRLVWRELSLRALVEGSVTSANIWRMARPDVFSVRNTSVEAYLHPVVHEIKVSRADLLNDLRNPDKGQAYAWLCCECYYVFPAGIASVDEIPERFGVWVAQGSVDDGPLELLRPARHSACQLPFAAWMAMARTTPLYRDAQETPQRELGGDA